MQPLMAPAMVSMQPGQAWQPMQPMQAPSAGIPMDQPMAYQPIAAAPPPPPVAVVQMERFYAICPEGVNAGDTFSAMTPAGRQVSVIAPPGAQ